MLIDHSTYHHFTNNGQSDSNIDVLLNSEFSTAGFPNLQTESLLKILCSKTSHLIESSHDLLVSSLTLLPSLPIITPTGNISAPRVPSDRQKIVRSQDRILH